LGNERAAARSTKAIMQQEAARFGVIAVVSTLGHADAPSPWASAAVTGGERDPLFDGAVETPVRVASR
jgi:hypothetical protein